MVYLDLKIRYRTAMGDKKEKAPFTTPNFYSKREQNEGERRVKINKLQKLRKIGGERGMIDAIEAFAAVACAFLSVRSRHLEDCSWMRSGTFAPSTLQLRKPN